MEQNKDSEVIYQPQFLNEAEATELKKTPHISYVDAFERQLKELFFIENTKYIGTNKEETYATEDFKNYVEAKKDDYVHVYFSWNNHLVKTVTKDNYLALKTNRNQDLITSAEQKRLSAFKVAVLGMSVGSNIAFVLTQAGISNEIILADFDELDTTNLNRILAGVHQVGVNKTIVAARKIYEDNPFAEVTILPHGINETNLEEFLKGQKIDCIIEEIDDMPFKIHTRMLAMKYKIPVLMITDNGDGVVAHVERYDLGYSKIWGKEFSYYEEKLKAVPFGKEQAGQMIMFDIVGGPDRVDPKMLMSVQRVLNRELVSWSQLGSAAILGGVMATYFLKQIALGLNNDLDIRAYIFPDKVNYSDHSK